MSNDETEAPVFYADARDGLLTSAAAARRKALKHFDYFLVGYCMQIGVCVVTNDDIPYHGIPPATTEKDIFRFWDDLFGAFATYLGKYARAGCNPKGTPISRSTAAGYCSAVKNFFANTKFRTEPPIPIFQKEPFGRLTQKIEGLFRESKRASGKVETEEGGQPVTFDDITEDVESLKKFTAIIFEDDTCGRWSPKVRELLIMTLLLRYDQFMSILQSHPCAKLVETYPDVDEEERYSCSSVEDNLFVNRVNQALERTCEEDQTEHTTHGLLIHTARELSDRMFSTWVEEARKAFVSRNNAGLPILHWSSYGVDPLTTSGPLMDTRTVIDHFNLLASVVQANQMELLRQRHILNDLQQAFNVESKITSRDVVEKLFNMDRSLRRLEENLLGEAPKPEPAPSKPLKVYIYKFIYPFSSSFLPFSLSLFSANGPEWGIFKGRRRA